MASLQLLLLSVSFLCVGELKQSQIIMGLNRFRSPVLRCWPSCVCCVDERPRWGALSWLKSTLTLCRFSTVRGDSSDWAAGVETHPHQTMFTWSLTESAVCRKPCHVGNSLEIKYPTIPPHWHAVLNHCMQYMEKGRWMKKEKCSRNLVLEMKV